MTPNVAGDAHHRTILAGALKSGESLQEAIQAVAAALRRHLMRTRDALLARFHHIKIQPRYPS